jgi:hypothetical protein
MIFVGPQTFFGMKYFRAKGKIFVFLGKVPKFGIKNWGKVFGSNYNVLVRKNFFPKKLSTGGEEVVVRKNFFQEKKFQIGAPKKNLPRAPAKLSAALAMNRTWVPCEDQPDNKYNTYSTTVLVDINYVYRQTIYITSYRTD